MSFASKHRKRRATTEPVSPQQTPYGIAILLELNRSKHIYEGTVSASVTARRRAKNKAARNARRAHR